MKKRDLILIAIAIAILTFLWAAPEESTTRIPRDETHQKFYDIVSKDGKKAAEKFCEECHNPDGIPFSKNHPSKFRCLFCHKLKE